MLKLWRSIMWITHEISFNYKLTRGSSSPRAASVNACDALPAATQAQPFRLRCHIYLLCMVYMAACLKTQNKNVSFSTWEFKIGG